MILLIAGMIGLTVGLLANFGFGIWLLVIAFQRSIAWGLCSLFLPFVGLVFTIINWDKCWKPFVGSVVSMVFVIVGSVMMGGGIESMRAEKEGRFTPSVASEIENLKFAAFGSENKGYSVDLPASAKPSENPSLDNCLAGDAPGGSFLVGSTSLPGEAIDAATTQSCLDATVDRLVQGFGATAESRHVTGIATLAGRQVEGPMQDPERGIMRMAAYADPNRHKVYVLFASGKEYLVKSSAADRFFKSFKVYEVASDENATPTAMSTDRTVATKRAQDFQAAASPEEFFSRTNLLSNEEMSKQFVRYCFQSPLEESALTCYLVAPKGWTGADLTAAGSKFEEISQVPTELAELGCDSPHVTQEVWFVQPTPEQRTSLSKFFDSYCSSLGMTIVDKRESTNRLEALVKYDTRSVKGMLARLTFVRNDKYIFWLSGCAPQAEYAKWSNTFTAGALTFSPVGYAPLVYPEVGSKTLKGTALP